ncbi:MAG: hypothetical protein WCC73_19770, partial [Terracidiphilus sp.]
VPLWRLLLPPLRGLGHRAQLGDAADRAVASKEKIERIARRSRLPNKALDSIVAGGFSIDST